jgi:hypothetical protein
MLRSRIICRMQVKEIVFLIIIVSNSSLPSNIKRKEIVSGIIMLDLIKIMSSICRSSNRLGNRGGNLWRKLAQCTQYLFQRKQIIQYQFLKSKAIIQYQFLKSKAIIQLQFQRLITMHNMDRLEFSEGKNLRKLHRNRVRLITDK